MEQVMRIVGDVLIVAGVIFMLFGVAGMFRFNCFYKRLLISAKIDTVGLLTLIFGLAFRHGVSFFSGKILLIMVILLILNPLVSHLIVRSAYLAGHEVETSTHKNEDSES